MDHPWRHNGRAARPIEDRFWEKVDQSGGPDACWPWIGALNSRGRGVIQVNRRATYATRFVFTLTGRPLRPDQFACHSCDNPPCINPAHLYAGSHIENMADMRVKGRASRAPKSLAHRAKAGAAVRAHFAAHPESKWKLAATHCPQGHPYDEANTGRRANGHRLCRTCNRNHAANWRRRQSA